MALLARAAPRLRAGRRAPSTRCRSSGPLDECRSDRRSHPRSRPERTQNRATVGSRLAASWSCRSESERWSSAVPGAAPSAVSSTTTPSAFARADRAHLDRQVRRRLERHHGRGGQRRRQPREHADVRPYVEDRPRPRFLDRGQEARQRIGLVSGQPGLLEAPANGAPGRRPDGSVRGGVTGRASSNSRIRSGSTRWRPAGAGAAPPVRSRIGRRRRNRHDQRGHRSPSYAAAEPASRLQNASYRVS